MNFQSTFMTAADRRGNSENNTAKARIFLFGKTQILFFAPCINSKVYEIKKDTITLHIYKFIIRFTLCYSTYLAHVHQVLQVQDKRC